MNSNNKNTSNSLSKQEYLELQGTFDVIFINMKIADPAIYLNKIYESIRNSPFLEEFKEHCMGYFPTYPKRMSLWYSQTIIKPIENEKERANEVFSIITRFVGKKITSQLSANTFSHISSQELKSRLRVLDEAEGMSSVSLKYAEAFFEYAKNENITDLLEGISYYPREKQFYMIQTLVEKNWFNPSRYESFFSYLNSYSQKEAIYSMFLEKENNLENLKVLSPIFIELLSNKKIKEQTILSSLSSSTEKNKYFIENLVLTEEDGNKAIDYSMKYECAKDINSAVSFINYNLLNHFNDINPLEAPQVCLMISRCFIYRVKNTQFCELIVNLLDILKENDNTLYKQVYEKITSDQKFYIYEADGFERTVTFGTPEFKGFLSQILFESLSKELEDKPIQKKIKI